MVLDKKLKEELLQSDVTPAQIKLINELYSETDCKQQYGQEELARLDKDTASLHIQYLKDLKSRQYQERKNHDHVADFDKIGFGMVYKLVWKYFVDVKKTPAMDMRTFHDTVISEYKVFKQAQEACRQFVKDGGLQ